MRKLLLLAFALMATPVLADPVVVPGAVSVTGQPVTVLPVITVDTTGAYVAPSSPTPSAAATNAIVPGASAVAESNHVAKASPGNLYRVSITTGGTAGYLMGFNAVAAPADGAVTPAMCRAIAANSTLSINVADMPSRWSTGITFVFSSTGCFSKTASATAYFEWSVQ